VASVIDTLVKTAHPTALPIGTSLPSTMLEAVPPCARSVTTGSGTVAFGPPRPPKYPFRVRLAKVATTLAPPDILTVG